MIVTSPKFLSPRNGETQKGQIAQNNLPGMSEDEITAWKAKKELYESLRKDSVQLDSSEVLADFYSTNTTANIGKLTDAKQLIAQAADSAVWADSVALAAKIYAAKMANNTVTPDLLPEMNEKIVNEVYLNSIGAKQFHFDAQQMSDLMFVASQCIYNGGQAVVTARNLVHTQNPFILFDDEQLCGGSYKIAASVETENKIKNAYVRPNPAKKEIFIGYELEQNGVVLITDLTGRQIAEATLNKSEHSVKVDLTHFNNGIYFFKIKVNGAVINTGKFEVIK